MLVPQKRLNMRGPMTTQAPYIEALLAELEIATNLEASHLLRDPQVVCGEAGARAGVSCGSAECSHAA